MSLEEPSIVRVGNTFSSTPGRDVNVFINNLLVFGAAVGVVKDTNKAGKLIFLSSQNVTQYIVINNLIQRDNDVDIDNTQSSPLYLLVSGNDNIYKNVITSNSFIYGKNGSIYSINNTSSSFHHTNVNTSQYGNGMTPLSLNSYDTGNVEIETRFNRKISGGNFNMIETLSNKNTKFSINNKGDVNLIGKWNEGRLIMGNNYIWVDNSNNLRFKTSEPVSDVDGHIITIS